METKEIKMSSTDPFEYILGFALVGTTVSLIPDISEILRLILLACTAVGAGVKLWEQIKKSEHFRSDIIALWKRLTQKK